MNVEKIEITLDGQKLMVDPGKTILEIAESRGVSIPTLCNDRRLEPFASCWVCLVKVEKAKGYVPSCATRVAQGMVISTSSPDVIAARKMAFELLLSNHYGDCKAPCTLECPSNVDIQGYVALVANGKFKEAVELIRRDNPMPAVIGRVCPRPCEGECRRALVDQPVNVNGLKRFVADFEAEAGGFEAATDLRAAAPVADFEAEAGGFEAEASTDARPPKMGKKVAIVGAGPAGLSAAWYLSKEGVDVTVYEAMEKAGGMLRYGIPDYRLPPKILDRTIGELLSMGAALKTGQTLGKDFTLESLRAKFDAVVLAIGAWKSRGLKIPGEDHPAVLSGIEFLCDVNMGKSVKVGKRAAIIGGGNTALDAARCSLRSGAEKVTICYRRTREEMPAAAAEIEEALEEGIEIQYLVAPVSIQVEGAAIKTLTLLRMELGEPDASGRRRPVPVKGSEFQIPVDTVVSAVGQYPDTRMLEDTDGLVDEKGNLKGDEKTGTTPVPHVYAAGDLLTGADIAIRAVAGGKFAARSVLQTFRGEPVTVPNEFLSRKSDFRTPTSEDFKDTPRIERAKPKVRAAESRKKDFNEIEGALTQAQAVKEAERCLECGCHDLTECRLKDYAARYDAAATRFMGAVSSHPIDESHPFIRRDPSKCILCGRCVRICLEVQGTGVFGYIYRGFSSAVAPSFGVPFAEEKTCTSCGQCVSACPVGALTEKFSAGAGGAAAHSRAPAKTAPLAETVEEGFCTLCSVGCGLEYRRHGTFLTRVTERYVAPGNGKLCAKGRFGHAFLNDAAPGTPLDEKGGVIDLGAARARAARLISAAKHPVMKVSPFIAAEAIDAFMTAAAAKKIPVEGVGLEGLDPGWAAWADGARDGAAAFGAASAPMIRVLVGDIATSSNVAFTESYRLRKEGALDLWIVGHDDEPARRVASRVIPGLDGLEAALKEASASGVRVEIMANPQEVLKTGGEKAVLAALKAAAAAGARITLLWNARNAGYLFARLAAAGGAKAAPSKSAKAAAPDLVLDAGGIAEKNGVETVVWGRTPADGKLFIPMPDALVLGGTSHPSGSPAVTAGAVDTDALKDLIPG